MSDEPLPPARRMNRYAAALLAIVALLLAADRARLLAQFGFKYTDQDQALLWYASEEVAHGRWHEPCFYGQSYNVPVEAWLAAPAVALGAPPRYALPLTACALGLLPFALLSAHAARHGRGGAAAVILLIPLALPLEHAIVTSIPRAFVPGLAVGAVACVLLMARGSRFALYLGALMAVLAVTIGATAALLVAPVALYAVLRHITRPACLLAGLAGAINALPAPLAMAHFYKVYPERDLHPKPTPTFSYELLHRLPDRLDLLFGHFVPFGGPGWAALAALLVMVAVLLGCRRYLAAIAALVAVALVVAATGVSRTLDGGPWVFLSASRFFLAVPVLLAVCVAWADPDRHHRWLGKVGTGVIAVLLMAGVVAGLAKHRHFDEVVDAATSRQGGIFVRSVDELQELADRLALLSQQHDAPLVLFSSYADLTEVYALPSLTARRVETLFPRDDRRSWLMTAESTRVRGHLLLYAEREPWLAQQALRASAAAERVSSAPVIIRIDPAGQPAIEVAERLGISVRPF